MTLLHADLGAARLGSIFQRSKDLLARAPWITLAVALLAAGTMLVPAAAQSFQYERDALSNGQLWRIATCHLVHFSLDHFAWCALALLILGAACEMIDRRRFLICLFMSAMLIPIVLFEFQPLLGTYRGLSGIDSALFVLLLIEILRQRFEQRHWIGFAAAAALGAAFVAKIILEMCFEVTIFVDHLGRSFDPVPLAHLAGILAAVSVAALRGPECGQV